MCHVFRASKLLNELRNKEFNKLKNNRSWPSISAGDSVEIEVCYNIIFSKNVRNHLLPRHNTASRIQKCR